MANHRIVIDPLNPRSIARAQAEYARLLEWYDSQVDVFLEELAQIGRQAAEDSYGIGGAVAVTVEHNGNTAIVRANGDAVVFLEFGAGDTVNTGNMYANSMPFEVESGSYSRAKGMDANGNYIGQYARQGYWEFAGIRYTAIQPRNGMENAYNAIMDAVRETARRVFRA